MRQDWEKGEDENPEHYRWHAFLDFLAKERPLSPEIATALYELGRVDPDINMGGSMMGEILRLRECPPSLIEAGANSGRKHLERLAARRGAR
jgi:hypothetical protein